MAINHVALPQKYHHLTFNKHELQPLTTELQKKAEEELNELRSRRDDDIEEFRSMVANEAVDLHANMSNAFLVRFLRARKYNKERALELIKNYYKGKKKFNYILNEDLVPSQVKHVFEKNVLTVLPHPDSQGRTVFLFQAKKWNPCELQLDDIARALFVASEKLLEDPSVQVNGIVSVSDMEELTFQHVRQVRPMLTYAIFYTIQECMPVRVKAIHVIKENSLIDLVYALIKPLLKPKIKKRIFFHGHNLASLHEHIPPEHLPKAQGGTMCDEFDGSEWTKLMLESDPLFQEDFQYGYGIQQKSKLVPGATGTFEKSMPRPKP